MTKIKLVIASTLLLISTFIYADELQQCWEKQVKPLRNKSLTAHFSEHKSAFEHNWEPFKQTSYNITGNIILNPTQFLRTDTLTSNGKQYTSALQLDKDKMYWLNYGETEVAPTTRESFVFLLNKACRYSPTLLIQYLYSQQKNLKREVKDGLAIYSYKDKSAHYRIFIDVQTFLLTKAIIKQHDDVFGDFRMVINYNNYTQHSNLLVSESINASSYDNKIKDSVSLQSIEIIDKISISALKKTEKIKEKNEKKTLAATTERHNDHIHIVNLPHDNSNSLIVEFNDFLVVLEAALTSENGELIIKEAQKIAPEKPIKHFVSGHHHPHYAGGLRAFVHKKASIISIIDNFDYYTYIAQSKRSIQPDSLHMQPQMIKIEIVDTLKIISDDSYSMQIYKIGEKSAHTNDYLIFYFPEEKLLFEGDLVYLPSAGNKKTANHREKGLYNAINSLNLKVDTIIQSWVPDTSKYKSVFSFSELEKLVLNSE